VPSSKIGSIIGKSGQVVRSIYAQSGAKIQISGRPETTSDGPPVDQEVNVQGRNGQSITAAVRILLGLLFPILLLTVLVLNLLPLTGLLHLFLR